MKKYLYSFIVTLLGMGALTACSADDGQEPGNDSTPTATVYQFEATGYNADSTHQYNKDNDCFLRIATNSATKEVYYLAELTDQVEARGMNDSQYADYVVQNGTKIEGLSGAGSEDLYIIGLKGLYTVAVVAVKGNTKTIQTTDFAGLDYKPYGTGSYYSDFFEEEWEVDIEYSEVGNRYRIADCWYDGYGFAFSPSGSKVTVYPTTTETGYVHSRYGMVSVTDTGSTYDAATKTFTFAFKWTVAAGSFGVYNDELTLN